MSLIATQAMTSEILQKIISTVAYRDDRWIRLYMYKTVSIRLQPVRFDNTVVFIDCTAHKAEVGYVDFTVLPEVKEFHIDYFEVHEILRKQGYGREMSA
jgi:ribosomal protein S18 acetylase RimI-like enzyme